MYIEFELPRLGGAHATAQAIKIAIARWAQKYNISQNEYSEKTIKYTHRLGFNREEYFSLFSMTWDQHFEFKIVNIVNEKY
jgi:hypothetical protein